MTNKQQFSTHTCQVAALQNARSSVITKSSSHSAVGKLVEWFSTLWLVHTTKSPVSDVQEAPDCLKNPPLAIGDPVYKSYLVTR